MVVLIASNYESQHILRRLESSLGRKRIGKDVFIHGQPRTTIEGFRTSQQSLFCDFLDKIVEIYRLKER